MKFKLGDILEYKSKYKTEDFEDNLLFLVEGFSESSKNYRFKDNITNKLGSYHQSWAERKLKKSKIGNTKLVRLFYGL